MTNKAIFLLNSARRNGITITVSKGELQLKLAKGTIDADLLREIKENKQAIIDFLTNDQLKSTRANSSDNALKPFDRDAIKNIPLTFSQERLWFIDRFEGSVQYHLPTVLNLRGNLNLEGISHALQTVVSRHESLRSVIYEADGGIYQRVIDASLWELAITDGSNYKENRAGLHNHIRDLISKPFDLTLDYMLRAMLIKLGEAEHLLVVTMHHIASDGWSLPVIVKEVIELYSAYVAGRSPVLPTLSIQYADYAVWQRNYLQGRVLENKMSYWKEKLTGVSPLQLPTDFARPAIQSTRGTTVGFVIGKEDTDTIQQFCNREAATLFMTLLSVFKVLLHRYSGQQDICVGIPIAGRQQEEVEGLVGFFVNTLALRTQVKGEESFTTLLAAVKDTTMGAYEHQEAPFEKVVEQVVKERDPGRSPLFQVMFVLQNTPEVPELSLPGLTLSGESFENKTSKYDISFYVTETVNGLHCAVEYCTDLYHANTIDRMIVHYRNLLNAIIQSPGQKLSLLPMLDDTEQQQLLESLSGKVVDYPLEKNLLDLFEEQASKIPQSIALVFEKESLTYGQLNDRSNRVANYLISKKVMPGDLVPVCMERSFEMVIGILSILKAGGTYVPIDAGYPEERISYMLEDTKAKILVTNKGFVSSFSNKEAVMMLCVDEEDISKASSSKPETIIIQNQPACIIYTSGSSGRPKGVKLGHAGIVNRLYWMWESYPFEADERNAIKTSIGFVDHVWELFGSLNKGIPSVIFSNDTILDVDKLLLQLSAEKITRLVLVPSLLQILLNKIQETGDSLPQLKYWTSSGEKLPAEMVAHFYRLFPADKNKLLNIYGSSEVTADVSCYDTSVEYKERTIVQQSQLVPIGHAIDNTSLYIMDAHQQLVARGIAGEICVGGVQVGQGYLNLPELSNEKFIADPFSTRRGSLMFRTGDQGKLLMNGNIVCLGRIDDQVKIRGNRVELGEIESVLLQNKSVQHCVVLAQDDMDGNKLLVAYIVAKEEFDREALMLFLRSKLPEYMVPLIWIKLEELPLTANGKIDKKALPVPGAGAKFEQEYVAPSTPLQEQLVVIWEKLLKKNHIGVTDNFFELGGHSLLAMRLVSAIRSELKLELSIKELFSNPTIGNLSAHLQKTTAGLQPSIELLPRPQHIPLSFSQERLWFIDRLEGSIQYHIPAVLRLKGKLNIHHLTQALKTIVDRHEVLRTVILEEDGLAWQQVRDHSDWQLSIAKLPIMDDAALQTTIRQMITAPFDLAVDYMLRANLLVINEQEHILVATIHHIATDGWSMSVLVKELVELYRSFEENRQPVLNPLPIQYADFAIWQRNYLQGDLLQNKISYWQKKLDGVEPLQLPLDYPRPAIKSNAGSRFGFLVDKKLTDQLQQLSLQQDTTLFMTLLAAFKVLLHRHSGQEDICVGIPIANRTMHEVEELIGFFVNTLALRNEVNDAVPFVDLLQHVRATTMEAYEHQDTPFEKVVDVVVKERDLGRSPVFQVMFVWQNTPEIPRLVLGDLLLSREGIESKVSKFDITLTITETSNGLYAGFDYCTQLFNEQSVEKLATHLTTLLKSIVVSPAQAIGSLPMLAIEEEYQVLAAFNDASVAYPKGKTIIDLFEEQVTKNPTAIALVFGQEQLTYAELNQRSNQLANYLQSRGVKQESLVPLFYQRSADMIVALLAILKAGGAYVPIDPDYPEERIGYLLKDTGAKIILSNSKSSSRLKAFDAIEIIETDTALPEIIQQPAGNLPTKISAHQLAYVIYTSGSTGKPKGVMIEHGALLDHCFGVIKSASLQGCNSFALFAPLVFDAGHSIIHSAFILGAAIHVMSKQLLNDGEKLAAYVNDHAIDCVKIVPSLWLSYADSGNAVLAKKVMIFGGDSFSVNVLDRLVKLNYAGKVFNHYGPTETTIGKTIHRVDLKKPYTNIPIGKPFSNTSIFILNKSMQPVPVGVPGELYIAGEGLARGYLNNPLLTAEKFIPNPFSNIDGAKMYRTGDLARWLPDGNIEYLGRVDEQVKIRGFRIEPGEIEAILKESGLIQQAVVLTSKAGGSNKVLVAYIVPANKFDKVALVDFLQQKIPDYMIPSVWVPMLQMPLTSNGKIDRKALPAPDVHIMSGNQYIAPRNPLEQVLADTWQELLGVDKIGIHDNFFELGGDSIITIQVVSRVRRKGYEFQVADIFTHQTIAKLAMLVEQRSQQSIQLLGEQGILKGAAGLLPIQQRFFAKEHTAINHFNQTVLLQIDKRIDEVSLRAAVQKLLLHHDALRFKFSRDNGQWQQEYGDRETSLITDDFTLATSNNLGALITEKATSYQQSLDIEQGDLIRVSWMKTPGSEINNRLLIVIHHLVVDGVSWRILLEDIELLLSGFIADEQVILPYKTASYRQVFTALETYGKTNRLLAQLPYWEKIVSSFLPLPTDKSFKGPVKVKDRGILTTRLNAATTVNLLQDTAHRYHTEINDLLLCALYNTISEYTRTNKIIIGLEGHGRQDGISGIDTSRTVGWFSSHYPLLLSVKAGRETMDDSIKTIKEQLRQVPDKGLGYGVSRYINKEASLQGEEPWDIVFNYFGQLDNVLTHGKWLQPAKESTGASVSEDYQVNEKISVNSSVQGGELVVQWGFSKMHFETATIQQLANAYIGHLEKLVEFCVGSNSLESRYTPSDFGLSNAISYEELDRFLDEPVQNKPRRERLEGLYELSALQQGVLFHSLYETGAGTYIQQFACDLAGADIAIFTQSWNAVIKHHSILRTAFYHDVFDIPVQVAFKEVELPLVMLDFRDMDHAARALAVTQFENSNRTRSFDYKSAPLMRLALIRLQEDRYRMIWSWSHILFDGWSMPILVEEFLTTYESLLSGKEMMQVEEDRYEDYILYTNQRDKEKEQSYWRNYLKGIDQNTLLPFIGSTRERTKGAGEYKTLSLELDEAVSDRLQQFAQTNHITLNTIMQGVWSRLLHQYTGNENVVYGVIVSGRPDDLAHVERRVGLYINVAPLHSVMQPGSTIEAWLQNLQLEQVASRLYQYTPLSDIQAWTGVQGDFFDTLMVFENYPVSKVVSSEQWSLKVEKVRVLEQTNYPLTIIIVASGEKTGVHFSYNTSLLTEAYMQEIRGHFENVLLQLIDNSAASLNRTKLTSAAEEKQLLESFNGKLADYPTNKSIIDLFETQSAKKPGAVALLFEEETLSFDELNKKANQFAHYLLGKGVKNEALIPICIDRGIDMLVAILGVLKAGAAYVPIDPEYPAERIDFMLKDVGAVLVISNSTCSPLLPDLPGMETIEIDKSWNEICQQPVENLTTIIQPGNLAYLIYTSGSTGKPKGVLVEHKGMVNLAFSQQEALGLARGFRMLQFASFGFDASCYEIFITLLNGGALVLPKKEELLSAAAFEKLVNKHAITLASLPPSYLQLVKDGLGTLTTILSVGEALNESIARQIQAKGIRLINGYGPTENTVCVSLSFDPVLSDGTIVIGKPTANVRVYILDKNQHLSPVGTIGEIYVAGPQVARGYLNLPDLTSAKFIANPFSDNAGDRMYKTGDLGRWLPDGNMEYMGRADDQVKIRGFRIEPGEIENVLMQSGLVEQVVVMAQEDGNGQKRLVGYFVAKNELPDNQSLSTWLHERLPAYMVPAAWVSLEQMPLTTNGKIDKKALPNPGTDSLMAAEYAPPVNEIQTRLVEICQELLGLRRIGIHDNFFELGGHSLLAMRLIAAIKRELGVELPVKTFFELVTIERVANYIKINRSDFNLHIEDYDEIKL